MTTKKGADNMFKVEVQADSSGTWTGNSLEFDNMDKATEYAVDLSYRWTAVRKWRVVEIESGKVVEEG